MGKRALKRKRQRERGRGWSSSNWRQDVGHDGASDQAKAKREPEDLGLDVSVD
jgi:hypothetical protein